MKIKGGLNSFKNALIVQPNLQLDTSLPAVIEEPIETELVDLEKIEFETAPKTEEDKVEPVKTETLYFNWR